MSQIIVDYIIEDQVGVGVNVDNVEFKNNEMITDQIITDAISEKTLNNGVTIDGVVCKDNDVTCNILNYTLIDFPKTFGEIYIARKSFDNTDWAIVTSTGTRGVWALIGTGTPASNVFVAGESNGVTVSTSGITIITGGIYLIEAYHVGNISGTTQNLIEIAYTINGAVIPSTTASTQILMSSRESSGNDNNPQLAGSSGSFITSLNAADVVTFSTRWVAGNGSTQTQYIIKLTARVTKL